MDFQEIRKLPAQQQLLAYRGLTNEDRRKIFHEFEAFHQPFMDKFYADNLGCSINRAATKDYDAILIPNSRESRYQIEEKYRTSDFSQFLIEVIQDVSYPIQSENWIRKLGWFYTEKAEKLIDIICYNRAGIFTADKPNKVYVVDLPKLRGNLHILLKKGANHSLQSSGKGSWYSLNIAIDWEILLMNDIAQKYII